MTSSRSDPPGDHVSERAGPDTSAPTAFVATAPHAAGRAQRRRRWLWWTCLAVGLLIGALMAIHARQKPRSSAPPPPTPVITAVAQSGDVPIYLDGIGTVQAYNNVTVHAQVDGTLTKVAFVEGQDVKAGEVLAQIDPSLLRAQLDQAIASHARDVAQLANARVDLQRYITLVAQDSIATQQLDTQRALVAQLAATVQSDAAQIAYARVQLGHTSIVSPISGRTGVRLIDAGNIVHAADATGIVTVTQIEPISILFTLPEDATGTVLRRAKAGPLSVSATLRNDDKPAAHGVLLLVNNQIDSVTGTVQLKATFPNKDHVLWPGQFADVRLLLETRRNAVTIPPGAVQRGPQGEFVFVVLANGTVQMRSVRSSTSNAGGAAALIEAGLAAGERVVTDGQLKLRSGARVRLLQPAAPGARGAVAPSPS